MLLSDVSIRRPVFATVMNILVVVAGVVAYIALPVREFPDIDYPVVNVSTIYFGASPETIEATIVEPIEQVLNGIEGILPVGHLVQHPPVIVYRPRSLPRPKRGARDCGDR